MRLDHLLSRVSGQDPTTDPDPKFALRGEGQRLKMFASFLSLLSC